MSKITSYTELTTPASNDMLMVVDVSDTTMASSGTTKKISVANVNLGTRPIDWANAVVDYAADNSGATDATTAINNALASGSKLVYLPAGTFLVNGSSALALATAGQVLMGAGNGLTKIQIGGSFSAAEVINITAATGAMVRDLSIVGASSTITSNPVCNGIEVQPGVAQYVVENVFTQYINGYAFEAANDGSSATISRSIIDKFWAVDCAGGMHFNGLQRTVGTTISNIVIAQIGVASGLRANNDSVLIEDSFDMVWTNCQIGIGNAGTGHAIHIKGNSSAIWFNGFDVGGFPTTLANSQCGVLIEDGGGNSAQRVRFSHGVFQTLGQGAQVSGAASRILFLDVQFVNNQTHGAQVAGTGTGIHFMRCSFSGNGAGGTGNNYDLLNSGTAAGWVDNCDFLTTTGVTAGTGAGTQNIIGMANTGTEFNFRSCHFNATGQTLANIFQKLPMSVHNSKGYNPHGSVTVSVPATGVATAAQHYDCFFYITAGTGGCTVVRNTGGEGGGASPTITIPAGAVVPVFVRAGCTITPTFTNAPTWVVDGN